VSAPNGVNQGKEAEGGTAKEIADRLNRMTNLFNRRIQFEVPFEVPVEHEDVLVKIIDRETGQVIRQIPPDELVKLAERMEEIYGMIFRAKP
jgi:flagellar protein FlaG